MSFQTTQGGQNRKQIIKKFQSRVLNRSCADFIIYDKVADYLLECCSAQAKPNTLSIFSVIPLIVCNLIITPGQWWSYLLAFIAILMHQIFDIANKKQAYRLSQFTFSTYYIDHLYDSISAVYIVNITTLLFQMENQTRLTCIFFFAMLPFFTHHLAMYSSGYLTFYTWSPAVEGLLILQILFVGGMFFPSFHLWTIFQLQVSHIVMVLCYVWLAVFLIDDIRTIGKMKKQLQNEMSGIDNMPIKNLFVIGVLGYVIMQITTIDTSLLKDSLYFSFIVGTFTLLFTVVISELVLSYGYSQKHRQFTLNTLLVLFFVVVFYSVCGFAQLQDQTKLLMGNATFGILLLGQILYFVYYHAGNMKYLNKIIKQDF